MTAMDFPNSPSNGTVFTSGGASWTYNGVYWAPTVVSLPYAPIASPTFTGDPKAPTPLAADNDTSLATTAFVKAQNYVTGGPYVVKAGDTMTGALTIKLNAGALPAPIDPAQIHIGAADATHVRITMDTFGTGAYPSVEYKAARGTAASLGAVQTNDIFGVDVYRGHDGTNYALGAQIFAMALEPWTATAHGTGLNFCTTPRGSTGTQFPLLIGQGVMVGTSFANDPGPGCISLSGNLTLSTNNNGIYGRKADGTTGQFMFGINTNNNLVIGDGVVPNNLNGHTISAGNNLFLLGNTGSAFSNVVAYAISNISDVREKTDIADLPDCLGLIQQITPKRYKYREGREEDKDRVRWGLIAQEVEGVMKKAGHDFGGHYVGDDEKQTQGLSYADLTAVLWKAVQELSAQVTELQAKVAA